MRVIGRDKVTFYNESHFQRQTPGKEAMWQDSTWLHWCDVDGKVGGVHRIGHEYNIDGGPKIALWSNLVTPKGVYKKVLYLPMREQDKLPNGWGGGDDTCRNIIEKDQHIWEIDDPALGVSAKLVFRDFHETFCGFPNSGRTFEDIAPQHIDVGGTVNGTITMQGTTFQANGMGVRDHGWGHRNLGTMLSHRYCAGVFGPDLSFCAWAIHNGVNDSVEAFGWVVKGDTIIFAKDIDIVAYTDIDSASTRGGHITLTLANDEVIDCELTPVAPGLMNYFHIMPNLNTLCRATVNGRHGSGMLESSMNFHQGSRRPKKLQRGLVQNGFYPDAAWPKSGATDSPYITKRTL